jgi:putative FmdB family regulatory protein
MPLYEYQCSKCGHRFERIQKFSDEPVSSCPECKGKVARLLSSPAIQFKGSGWYVTDYAGKGKAKSETPEHAEEPAKKEPAKKEKGEKKEHKEPGKKKEPAAKS